MQITLSIPEPPVTPAAGTVFELRVPRTGDRYLAYNGLLWYLARSSRDTNDEPRICFTPPPPAPESVPGFLKDTTFQLVGGGWMYEHTPSSHWRTDVHRKMTAWNFLYTLPPHITSFTTTKDG